MKHNNTMLEYPQVMDDINPQLARKALEELNEKPEQRDRDIQALKEMIAGEIDLTACTDDAFLLRFLRARKFNVDRAFKLLRKFYLMKDKDASLYANFRPSRMLTTFNENLHIILPERDDHGRRVFLIRPGYWNPEVCPREDFFLCMHLCLESIISEEETQINGTVTVIDMEGFSLYKATYITPGIVKRFISLVQECFPARVKGMHFVNEPSFFGQVFMIIKSFMNKKIASRVFFHGHNRQSLHEHLRPEILPSELGGSNPPTDNSEFVESLLKRDDEIANSFANYGYL